MQDLIALNVFDGNINVHLGRGDIHTFKLGEDATRPKLKVQFYNQGSLVDDITAATISMINAKTAEVILNDVDITSQIESSNKVVYDWSDTDVTAAIGSYWVRLAITYGGDDTAQPVDEKILVKIVPAF